MLSLPDGTIGVPPGALVLGHAVAGQRAVPVLVERLVDMGPDIRVLGRVGASRVEITLPPGQQAPVPNQIVSAAVTRSVPIIFSARPEPEQR